MHVYQAEDVEQIATQIILLENSATTPLLLGVGEHARKRQHARYRNTVPRPGMVIIDKGLSEVFIVFAHEPTRQRR